MGKYAFLFFNDESFLDRTTSEVEAVYAEIKRWADDLERRGVLKGGRELQRRRTATTVRRVNGSMQVFDGPFIETKEHIGGWAIIDVVDRDEAIRIARAFPGGVEVRPIVER